nr:hypothetical protein [Tanacetum cinerariifolium]
MPSPKPKKTQNPRQSKRNTTKVPYPSKSTDIATDEVVYKEGVTVWRQDTIRDTSAHIRYERVSKMSSDSLLTGVNTTQSDKDRLKHIELIKICITLQKKVPDLEDELKRTKTVQQTKIDGLERRVKKLEKKQRSRTHKLKRLYKERIDEIDADEDIALVSTHGDVSNQDNIVQDEGIQDVGEEEVVEVVTTTKMLIDIVVDVIQVTTVIADILVSAAETIVTTAPTVTLNLQSQVLREKFQQSEEVNIAWDDVQAKIDADYELAQRLQAEEQDALTDAEKAKNLIEFLEKRRMFFAAKRAEEKRNRPPTKAQQRSLMCNYLKNMDG